MNSVCSCIGRGLCCHLTQDSSYFADFIEFVYLSKRELADGCWDEPVADVDLAFFVDSNWVGVSHEDGEVIDGLFYQVSLHEFYNLIPARVGFEGGICVEAVYCGSINELSFYMSQCKVHTQAYRDLIERMTEDFISRGDVVF